MATGGEEPHTLVVYGPSARADAALRQLAERGGRVTAVRLVAQESEAQGCCDTRSVLWNGVCRDFARDHLARAARVVGPRPDVEFVVLAARVGHAVETLKREANLRGADEIVLADPRASGLTRLERRRLRRSSLVPASP
jgi:predicted DNA binding protein